MKIQNYLAVLVAFLAFVALSPEASAQSRNPMTMAKALWAQGENQKAVDLLEKNKRWPGVPALLYVYNQELAKGNVGVGLEGQLAKVMFPEVNFDAVPLNDALTYIQQRTTELTNGEFTPNIIYSGTSEQAESSTVTLRVKNLTAPEILKYIGSLTRSKIRYDKHAVMVSPYVPAPVAAPTKEEYNPFAKN